MNQYFDKETLVSAAERRDVAVAKRSYQDLCVLIALVEIREAIDAQTTRLGVEQEHWDQAAFAKLAQDVDLHRDILDTVQATICRTNAKLAHDVEEHGGRLERLAEARSKFAEQYNRTETLFSRVEALERSIQGQAQVNQIMLDVSRVQDGKIAALEQNEIAVLHRKMAELTGRVVALEGFNRKYELIDRHVKELCGEINGFSAQVQACMDATKSVIDHQQETATLLTELAEKAGNVPAAGGAAGGGVRTFAQPPGGEPTAG